MHPVFLRWEEEVLDSWIELQTQAAVSPLKAERDQRINQENDLKLKLDGLHAHITVMEDLQTSGQQGRAADQTLEESLAEQHTGLLEVKGREDAKIRRMQEKLADLQRQRIELEASIDRSENVNE
ncbi:hypothetical protein EWM64_g935 [Hericium alpestre]|uniref:Uncharacterized protein n=1 Tax=Hericium alpestre TaxID=135208 RepID=A0A4Z0A7K2_9AGAM|nr:hypothetical protein EWM64_g935 [Hericium alpestre]